jgi:hypothetical protein
MGRPPPVFLRKGVQRKDLDTELIGRLDHSSNAVRTAVVTVYPWSASLICPATISVHNDGNVIR